MINTWVGDEALGRLNNETDREYVGRDQEKACADIEEQLGIKPVHFMYELKGMEFDGYEVDIKAKTARMFYFYNNSIITILMRQDERGIAKGSIKDGDIKEVFEVNTDIGIIEVAGMERGTDSNGDSDGIEPVYDFCIGRRRWNKVPARDGYWWNEVDLRR